MACTEAGKPPEATEVSTWQVVVKGQVQGVGYRYFTLQLARELGIAGWARNDSDGSVRVTIQHRELSVLTRMVVLLKQGPPRGWVEDCEVEALEGIAPYAGFTICS